MRDLRTQVGMLGVDTHRPSLRRELTAAGAPNIHTVRGAGYTIRRP